MRLAFAVPNRNNIVTEQLSNTRKVSLREVAAVCGLSVAGTSLALREHPSIPTATRAKARAAAARLGYEPNRALARMLSGVRKGTALRYRETLGYVLDVQAARGSHWPALLEGGIRSRASELGYGVERVERTGAANEDRVLSRMLRARGVRGLIVSPQGKAGAFLDLRWEHFAAVAVGYTLEKPALHRVGRDIVHSLQGVYAELRRRGYRRIGLVGEAGQEARMDGMTLAATLLEQWDRPEEELVRPLLAENLDEARFLHWVEQERPDVVVTLRHVVQTWLRRIPRPRSAEAVAFFSLNAIPDQEHAGLQPDYRRLGSVAVEQVIALVEHGHLGVPAAPVTVLVPGKWQEGLGLRGPASARSPKAGKA